MFIDFTLGDLSVKSRSGVYCCLGGLDRGYTIHVHPDLGSLKKCKSCIPPETMFALGTHRNKKETNNMKSTCPKRSQSSCTLREFLRLALGPTMVHIGSVWLFGYQYVGIGNIGLIVSLKGMAAWHSGKTFTCK